MAPLFSRLDLRKKLFLVRVGATFRCADSTGRLFDEDGLLLVDSEPGLADGELGCVILGELGSFHDDEEIPGLLALSLDRFAKADVSVHVERAFEVSLRTLLRGFSTVRVGCRGLARCARARLR